MDLEKLSAEYDRIYKEADNLFREYNPCQFKGNQCARNRKDLESGDFRNDSDIVQNGCCGTTGCKYLTPKGCDIKALGCKLHTCSELHRRKHKQFYTKIKSLTLEARGIFGIWITECYWDKKRFLKYLKKVEHYKRGEEKLC